MMLELILESTRRRVLASMSMRPPAALAELAARTEPPVDFATALRRPGIALIAEVKRRSPSRGDLRPDLEPAALAEAYRRGGAAAISVLTEPQHFGGSLADLAAVRAALPRNLSRGEPVPVLRKDFTVHPYQIMEARVAGADAILLIVAALTDGDLAALSDEARRWGLACLVEVHDEAELARALRIDPQIIGINSRNLRTMEVDLTVVERLRPAVPPGILVVAESGVRGPEDVRRLRDVGVDAILVGEALVRSPSPEATTRVLVEAGR
ncbi:MAG: indole-3-glycerol phosphate synthase TrpC [Anaerolineae bacterium]|nr:indole-3-glycerol phosphate synthase TrpC [Anaerolineae bacterium]